MSLNLPIRFVLPAVLLIAGLAAYWFTNVEKPVAVTIVSVQQGEVVFSVSNTRAGTVEACNRARLSPLVSGQLVSLLVDTGDRVEKGQVLMELWNEDQQARLALRRHEKTTALAHVQQACAGADVAVRERDRSLKLWAEKMISDEQIDIVKGEAAAQGAACRAAKSVLAACDAQIALVEAGLAQTHLRAPFDGLVAEINGEVGEIITSSLVSSATDTAIDLFDDRCMYVSAPIDEIDAPSIRQGMSATITLDAFADKKFKATVKKVAPYVLDIADQARTVEVEVEFAEYSAQLLPGYSADVEVHVATSRDTRYLPAQAVIRETNGDARVMIINMDGVLESVPVETGLQNWDVTEILSGPEVGDEVVLSVDREGVVAGRQAGIELPDDSD